MGRPKLDDVRRPQILDAFAACCPVRDRWQHAGPRCRGAGVTRALVRHYLGNRDEVVVALAEHHGHGVVTIVGVGGSSGEFGLSAPVHVMQALKVPIAPSL